MTKDFIVGLFFLFALFLLLSFTLFQQGGTLGADRYELVVFFDDISGLTEGDQVRIRGLKVGEVGKPEFLPEAIRVPLELTMEQPPRTGYSVRVLPASTLGGTYVAYDPGEGALIPSSERLAGSGSVDLISEIGNLFSETREPLVRTINNLEKITVDVQEGKGLVGRLFTDEELADSARNAFANLEEITRKVDEGEGVVGMLVNDNEARDRAKSIIEDAAEAADKISTGTGPLGTLIYSDDLSQRMENIAERLENVASDIDEGTGLLGRLVGDETMGQNGSDLVDNLNQLAEDARTGKGIVPRLLNDEELADKFEQTVLDLSDIMAQVRSGKGTLGQLVYDDKLATEMNRVFVLVRETTEDVREQVPINAFWNVLLGAF